MKHKELDEILAVWLIIGMIVCMFPVAIIGDHFDFAVNGARLFSVDDNPFVDIDEIDEEHRDAARNAMQSLEDTWGDPNAFVDTRFNFELPNITNVGVILALNLYCCFVLLWDYIGKKYVRKFILDRVKTMQS